MVPRFNGSKCPTCGTEFIEDLCPTQVRRRKLEKTKCSRAAKKSWKRRKASRTCEDILKPARERGGRKSSTKRGAAPGRTGSGL